MGKEKKEAKKMGRPTLGIEARNTMLRIRVNAKELESLDAKCKKLNKTRSEYLREIMNK